MKVSISLPDEDLEFLDQHAKAAGASSRSAVVQKAIRLLRTVELGPSYAAAWQEWQEDPANEVWEQAIGDGLDPARAEGGHEEP